MRFIDHHDARQDEPRAGTLDLLYTNDGVAFRMDQGRLESGTVELDREQVREMIGVLTTYVTSWQPPPAPSMTQWLADAPTWLGRLLRACDRFHGIDWDHATSDKPWPDDKRVPTPDLPGAEVVSSHVGWDPDDFHYPMLDIDGNAALIPSSTPGHHHLILATAMSWEDYAELLHVLTRTGVVEEGFCRAALDRKQSFLRLPWIRKGHEKEDARRSIEEWLDEDDRAPEVRGIEATERFLNMDVS